jgi:hypothetical protein
MEGSAFKIYKLKPDLKKLSVTYIIELDMEKKEAFGVAKIKMVTNKRGKKTNKIEQVYKKNTTTLAYSPVVIAHNEVVYNLHFPLRSSLEKENDFYVIRNEMLEIIGTGENQGDAEKNFAEEFDFIYKRYNQLDDNQLSEKLRTIKIFLKYLVKSVE